MNCDWSAWRKGVGLAAVAAGMLVGAWSVDDRVATETTDGGYHEPGLQPAVKGV